MTNYLSDSSMGSWFSWSLKAIGLGIKGLNKIIGGAVVATLVLQSRARAEESGEDVNLELVSSLNEPIGYDVTQQVMSDELQTSQNDFSNLGLSTSASDGKSNSLPQSAEVTITAILNDFSFTVPIIEGNQTVLTSAMFNYTGDFQLPEDLLFKVSNITHLTFAIKEHPACVFGTRFTYPQLVAGNVSVIHDGSESVPSFDLQLSSALNTGDFTPAGIDYTPVNDPPILTNNFLFARQNERVTITSDMLHAEDVDTSDADLIFTVSNVVHGQFEFSNDPGNATVNFTQAQIKSSAVKFFANGSTSIQYDVSVSDGVSVTSPSSVIGRVENNAFLVESEESADQYPPAITSLSDGRFFVVWSEQSNLFPSDSGNLYGKFLHPDGTESGGAILIATNGNRDHQVDCAELDNGKIAVSWGAVVSGEISIFFRILNPDQTFYTEPFRVESNSKAEGGRSQRNMVIAPMNNGEFAVAWLDTFQVFTPTGRVFFRVFNSEGEAKTNDVLVVSSLSGDPWIAFSRLSSRLLISYTRTSSSSVQDVLGRLFSAEGQALTGALSISTASAANRGAVFTALSDGNWIVVWTQKPSRLSPESETNVVGQLLGADGAKVGPELIINSFIQGPQQHPSVVALEDGGFLVVWSSLQSSSSASLDRNLFIQRFNSNGEKIGSESLITPLIPNRIGVLVGSEDRLIALNPLQDQAMILWRSQDETTLKHAIFGRNFSVTSPTPSSDTHPELFNFLLDTKDYIEGSLALPLYPSLTVLPDAFFNEILSNATIQFRSGFRPDEDRLTTSVLGGAVAFYNESSGVLTLSGEESALTYQAMLRNVTYRNLSNHPTSERRNVSVQLTNSNGQQSNELTRAVSIIPVNDAPQLVNSTLFFNQGESVLLTPSLIGAEDVDSDLFDLTYHVVSPEHLRFEWVSAPGVSIDSFNQAQLQSQQVRVIHDNSPVAPAVSISVCDGVTPTAPLPVSIFFENNPPVLGLAQLTVIEGQSVILSTSDLSATDDGDVSLLQFTVSEVREGYFSRLNAPTLPITTFTQGEVLAGQVQFIPNGGEQAPSFNVIVSDGQFTDGPVSANITFIPVNDAPTLVNPYTLPSTFPQEDYAVTLPNNTFIDVDSPELVRTISGLPQGLVFDPTSRRITGVVVPGQQGNHTIVDQVHDLLNGKANFTTLLTVLNRPAFFTRVFSDLNATVGEFFNVTLNITDSVFDSDGDALTIDIEHNGTWLEDNVERLTGIPEQKETVEVRVNCNDSFDVTRATFLIRVSANIIPPETGEEPPIAIILSGLAGGLAVLFCCLCICFHARRRMKKINQEKFKSQGIQLNELSSWDKAARLLRLFLGDARYSKPQLEKSFLAIVNTIEGQGAERAERSERIQKIVKSLIEAKKINRSEKETMTTVVEEYKRYLGNVALSLRTVIDKLDENQIAYLSGVSHYLYGNLLTLSLGNIEALTYLLEKNFNPNAIDHYGNTVLHEAGKYPEQVKLLIKKGAKLDQENKAREQAIHTYIRRMRVSQDVPYYLSSIQVLLEHGAALDNTVKALLEELKTERKAQYYLVNAYLQLLYLCRPLVVHEHAASSFNNLVPSLQDADFIRWCEDVYPGELRQEEREQKEEKINKSPESIRDALVPLNGDNPFQNYEVVLYGGDEVKGQLIRRENDTEEEVPPIIIEYFALGFTVEHPLIQKIQQLLNELGQSAQPNPNDKAKMEKMLDLVLLTFENSDAENAREKEESNNSPLFFKAPKRKLNESGREALLDMETIALKTPRDELCAIRRNLISPSTLSSPSPSSYGVESVGVRVEELDPDRRTSIPVCNVSPIVEYPDEEENDDKKLQFLANRS